MQKITTRKLRVPDIIKLESVLREHIRHAESGEVIESEVSRILQCMDGKADMHERTLSFLVATDHKNVLGCVAYATPTKQTRDHFGVSNSDAVELLHLFVSSKVSSGLGVGRALVMALCAHARLQGKRVVVVVSGPRYRNSWGFYDKTFDRRAGDLTLSYPDGVAKAQTWIKNI